MEPVALIENREVSMIHLCIYDCSEEGRALLNVVMMSY